jgi:lipoprotein-releasing system ATP-binding protein
VLDGIDLTLDSGEAIVVTGPSGCGKSTLLHILGTLDTPDSGDVRVGDSDPFSLGAAVLAAYRGENIGFVFQEHHLLPQCTVLENVLAASSDGDASAFARELLERVGLGERLDHRPSELSGGERQRTAVARALIRRPGLLLCDEPTGNLDAANATSVADLLLELQASFQATMVVVTHSEELAGRFQRRVTLHDARIAESTG